MNKFLIYAGLMAGFSFLPFGLKAQKTATILSQSENGITFAVDEDLPAPQQYLHKCSGEQMARIILNDEQINGKELQQVLATSFEGDSLISGGKDVFFQCIVRAYADHRPVCISPDMVWLLISQGFARYVNAHPEALRDQLINHTGKMDLVVESQQDLLSGQADWPKLLDGFAAQIEKYTKGDIAKTLTADFSTTRQTERIASEITLMESVKSYFNYRVISISCGIPNITLKGTPEDWKQVLARTRVLEKYGLQEWVKDLEPILTEFIHAAEGNPQQTFWQSIVKKQRVDALKGGGCSNDKPTELDGWLLKLFPDKDGKTLDKVPKTHNMPSERVRVGFKYNVVDPAQGSVVSETPMELLSGFVGIELDSVTQAMTPKIGWLVRIPNEEEESLARLKYQDAWNGGIVLTVEEVPEILAKLQHIKSLKIRFTSAVRLPDWMDTLTIDHFYIYIGGQLSKAEKEAIRQRFPNVEIYTTE
ncbi:MAG: DUF4419 domain-containing protein [Bacteroidaceae bacterium]|nr:DUF4419 domain-containing protein [Bacteroidaceae bacterium]